MADEWTDDPLDGTIHDAADRWDFPPPEYLVDRFLPLTGTVWVAGLPRAMKSFLLLAICLAIAANRSTILGAKILHRPKILYVAKEDSGGRVASRISEILSPWDVRPSPVSCTSPSSPASTSRTPTT